MDTKLEVVVLPVADADRAKDFFQDLRLTVTDIEAARTELSDRGAAVSDPDGNGWLLQEITTRLPGR